LRSPWRTRPRPQRYWATLGAAAQEIRRLRWALAQLITLAEEMPKLTDVELRTRLLMLAELGAR
jgi:hypothetical protein